MAHARLMLDTNVVVDYLNRREPHYEKTRLLMICGRMGEFRLLLGASQFTDLVYILSDGGRSSEIPVVLERLRGLRSFVEVCPVGATEVDHMLSTSWKDPEDALLYEAALDAKADCLITRNRKDFEGGILPVMDCGEFFDWAEKELGLCYEEVELQ